MSFGVDYYMYNSFMDSSYTRSSGYSSYGDSSSREKAKPASLTESLVVYTLLGTVVTGLMANVIGLVTHVNHIKFQPQLFMDMVNTVNNTFNTHANPDFLNDVIPAAIFIAIPLIGAIPALKRKLQNKKEVMPKQKPQLTTELATEFLHTPQEYDKACDSLVQKVLLDYKKPINSLQFKIPLSKNSYPLVINETHIRSDYNSPVLNFTALPETSEKLSFINLVAAVREANLTNKELMSYSRTNIVEALSYSNKIGFQWQEQDLNILSKHVNDITNELKEKLGLNDTEENNRPLTFKETYMRSPDFLPLHLNTIEQLNTNLEMIKKRALTITPETTVDTNGELKQKTTISGSIKKLLHLRDKHFSSTESNQNNKKL